MPGECLRGGEALRMVDTFWIMNFFSSAISSMTLISVAL